MKWISLAIAFPAVKRLCGRAEKHSLHGKGLRYKT